MRHFIPVSSISVESLADAFVKRIYALHETPDNIISGTFPLFFEISRNNVKSPATYTTPAVQLAEYGYQLTDPYDYALLRDVRL